jgi:hypothetical protein
MTSLAESLPAEQQRVRELVTLYLSIGAAGIPATLIMKDALRRAEIAASSGDIIAMIKSYEELKGFTL